MKSEYIIINKTAILKRIEELVEELKTLGDTYEEMHTHGYMSGEIDQLKKILSQSTPLIPEIEKAWEDGRDGTDVVGSFPFVSTKYVNKTPQDYISNLKLNI